LSALLFVAGLHFYPSRFVPIAQAVAAWFTEMPIRRMPDSPNYWSAIIGTVGLTCSAMFAWAFWKQPRQDQAIDGNLRKRMMIDDARRTTPPPD